MKKYLAIIVAAMAMTGISCSKKGEIPCAFTATTIQEAEQYMTDSLGEEFYEALPCLLSRFPESMGYDFPTLTDSLHLKVSTTADGRLRFYSYDTGKGGTMVDYQTLVQWIDEQGEIRFAHFSYPDTEENQVRKHPSIVDFDNLTDGDVATVSVAGNLPEHDGTPTYLIEAYMREMSTLASYDVMAIQIIDGEPRVVPAFVDADGQRISEIRYETDIPYWFFATKGRGWKWMNAFDDSTSSIYIPVIDENLCPTGRFSVYEWQEGDMKYARDDANLDINHKLSDFERLEGVYHTNTSRIRIDRMRDGRYRYIEWPIDSPGTYSGYTEAYSDAPSEGDQYYNFRHGNQVFRIPVVARRGELSEMYILEDGKMREQKHIE